MNGDEQGTLRAYVTGFGLSLILTLAAYMLVQDHVASQHEVFSHHFLMVAVGVLALLQAVVQLIFFLRLGVGPRSRWKTLVLFFMIGVVFIVVGGSLWIMTNLNYHMLPPDQLKVYMHTNEGL